MTDSDNEVRYSEDKPGIRNLMDIYIAITGTSKEEIEKEFAGKGYGEFKSVVGDAAANLLEPIQKRYYEIKSDKAYLDTIIKENGNKASYFANKTLRKVKKKVGLTDLIR